MGPTWDSSTSSLAGRTRRLRSVPTRASAWTSISIATDSPAWGWVSPPTDYVEWQLELDHGTGLRAMLIVTPAPMADEAQREAYSVTGPMAAAVGY